MANGYMKKKVPKNSNHKGNPIQTTILPHIVRMAVNRKRQQMLARMWRKENSCPLLGM